MTTKPTKERPLSSRAKRGICFFLLLCSLAPTLTCAQVSRPKIAAIARVRIDAGSTPADDSASFYSFYSALRLGTLARFQSGATVFLAYAVNDHQELDLQAGPRLVPPAGTPARNYVSLILFETEDVASLHDYLRSQKLTVSDLTAEPFGLRDGSGKSVAEAASLFTLQDPDGHQIGFIQYKSPLKSVRHDGQTSSHLIHAGFIVHDRAAMEHFYKDILGFRPYWHGGMKDDETSWISLQVPDGTDWVEFMVNVPENADQRLRGIMNHIALGVPDIHAAQKQLLTNGMKVTEEPKIGRDGKWQLNVYDPDQTRIEFMEFTPVQKPCCSEFTGPHPKP
jgi:catechol 2,3-dioxygenase-like lactoylglutathione lyase family enzyme